MRPANPERENSRPAEVNISPLIDMVFILLIFFIVTTVFVDDRGLQAAVPNEITTADSPALVFTLTSTGEIIHQGATVSQSGLMSHVRQALAHDAKTGVVIELQSGVATQLAVSALDSARAAGARNVNLTALE